MPTNSRTAASRYLTTDKAILPGGSSRAAPASPPHAVPQAGANGLGNRALWIAGLIGGIVGIVAWAFYVWAFHGDPGQDWMVFYTAARAWLDGNLPLIFDGEKLTAALNQRFAGWLDFTLNLHPWVYPPPFLLLFSPFGLLPPVVSFVAFVLSGFAAALAAVWLYLGPGRARAIATFSLVLCPAVPFNVMTGQNAFFTSALLVGGFALLSRSPIAAGVLLAIGAFKPQFWLMVPVALIAARQWRALASTLAVGLALSLLSLLVFGPDIWIAWVEMLTGRNAAYNAWLPVGRLNGISVFASLIWLGTPSILATVAQWLAVLLAAGFVYVGWRGVSATPLPMALLLGATMLAAPHASASDAVLLGLAASFYLAAPRARALRPTEITVAIAVWMSPLLNPPSIFRPGSFTPVLILLLMALALGEIRQRPLAATLSEGTASA